MGNCIYYYHHEADVYPSKVMFLTGSFVEPLQEVANERKGYWGIEISRNHEQVGGWTWTWTWTACRVLFSRGGSLTELLCACTCMDIIYLSMTPGSRCLREALQVNGSVGFDFAVRLRSGGRRRQAWLGLDPCCEILLSCLGADDDALAGWLAARTLLLLPRDALPHHPQNRRSTCNSSIVPVWMAVL